MRTLKAGTDKTEFAQSTNYTCDNCNRDISDGPHRLVLSEDLFVGLGSLRILNREQHFCGLKCLDQWSLNQAK
jgi:hypothetical protein